MITRRVLLASASASLLPLPSFAQSGWPDGKVIKGIVPFAAGSATDTIARV